MYTKLTDCTNWYGVSAGVTPIGWPVGAVADMTGDGLADFVRASPLTGQYWLLTSESNFVTAIAFNLGGYSSVVLLAGRTTMKSYRVVVCAVSGLAIAAAFGACASKQEKATPEPVAAAGVGGGAAAGAPGASGGKAGATTGKGGSAGNGNGGSSAGGGGMPNAGGGGGSAGATAGTGGGSTRAPHKPCATNLPGPSLVDVTISPSVGYCMDATLVTNGQYQAFLKATNDDVSGQSPECTQYVKTHVPTPTTSDTGPMGCGAAFKLWQPDTHPEWIFPCASWCDAAAYCKWAGKRLCGTLDGTDGTLKTNGAPSDYVDDPIRTELTHACSQGGKTLYHYGDTFDPSNGFHYGVDPAPTEANAKGTIAPFDQISGFNGEVSEWEAGCIPKGAGCNVKGGGYALNPAASAPTAVCNLHGIGNGYLQGSGFRCCTD